MKKLLLAICIISSFGAFAQTKDMKITMIKPADNDKIINGQPFNIEYVITNNGTVPTVASDSLIVLYIINTTQVISIAGQSPAIFTNKIMNAGDTIWRKFTINLTISGLSGPTPLPFCAKLYAQNGNVTIDPDQSNNNACVSITAPVSEIESALQKLEVYPNPASSILHISFDYEPAKEISIIDLSGRFIAKTIIEGNNTEINLSNLNNGMYLYQIIKNDGSIIKTGKFNVEK